MAQYGVGIIGTGWVSGEHIRAFARQANCEVRAICGRTWEKAEAKAKECGINPAIVTDYAELIARDDIDIVSIATPPHVHREVVAAAAKAGKHILLEKAMAPNLAEARAIRDAVAEAGVKSVVSFVLRWNPLFDLIKTQLAAQAIGDIVYGEVDYLHGIGPHYGQFAWNIKADIGASSLLSAGCHAMDALRWFMGGQVAEVFQYATRGNAPDYAPYEYDPTTITLLKFADGRIGKVASCIECVQPYVFHINLVGTQGSIRNNQIFSKKQFPGQTSWAEVPTILPDSGDVTHHPFTGEAAHLIACIETGAESHCNVADAYITHEVIFAADRSGKEGKPIALPLA